MKTSRSRAKTRTPTPSRDAAPAPRMRSVDDRPVDRILRRPEVERVTGLARSTIYQAMASSVFPSAVRIGERAVGWREFDILAWLESRPQGRRW